MPVNAFKRYMNTGGHHYAPSQKLPFFQAKLSINQPNDVYEQEADHVADQVMRAGNASAPSFFSPVSIQRKCKQCEEEEKQALRKESNALGIDSSASAEQYLSHASGGEPLAAEERSFFESRIGHDFSGVRIHNNSDAHQSAKDINALAYTHGNNIVFGSGQYNTGTEAGKKLMSHELTHVVQQGDGNNALQRKPVTSGEYGTELDYFSTQINHVPDKVATLLMNSPTYMNMARTLDSKYIALDGKKIITSWAFEWEPDKDGVLAKGPFKGRRVLAVWNGSHGSEFSPAGALGNDFGYDIIFLHPPYLEKDDQEVGEWLQIIAHETTHAFTRATTNTPAPATAADRITAAIKDEVATRANEALIVDEATRKGKRLPKYNSTTGSTDPAQAQRDMFPSLLKRTYLEEFVFNERVTEAIANENLSQKDIEDHNAFVDNIPLGNLERVVQSPNFILYYDKKDDLYETFKSKYDELRFIQRVIDKRWEKFEKNNGDPDAKEAILQEHATAFFNGLASYLAKP